MKKKRELIKNIEYWLDLTGIPKYHCAAVNARINDNLSISTVSRKILTFVETSSMRNVNINSKEVTTDILQKTLDTIIRKYQ